MEFDHQALFGKKFEFKLDEKQFVKGVLEFLSELTKEEIAEIIEEEKLYSRKALKSFLALTSA